MNKKCDACYFLENPNPKTQILETKYWSAGLSDNQAYFGRAYVTLRVHKDSLSKLSKEEWNDFEKIVKTLELVYKSTFGAEPLNWGCFMNHAFRDEPSNPHVHWHIYPRYSKPPVFDGISYSDEGFGSMYDNSKEKMVSPGVVEKIASKIRGSIIK